MTRNMGTADRAIRTVLAVAFLIVGLGVVQGVVGILLSAVAVVFLATSALGWCPLYTLFGLRTCPLQSATNRS